ncbi:MAG: AAA family ATPase [Bacteroidetes bacterium QH_2_64_74]|nr:MAG: AAA family ATPase [Bacteroidetes bacterium QH_2_64_74]
MPQSDSTSLGTDPHRNPTGPARVWAVVRSQFALWIGGAIVVALLVHFGLRWKTVNAPLTIEYSTFLDHVDSGHVERVEIVNGSRIRRAFVTTKPDAHELTAFLRRHNQAATETNGRAVTFTAIQEEEWMETLLLWGLPLGLIVGIWFFFMRTMTAGGRSSDLGDSTATLLEDDAAERVTFDDVAGLEEPKEEVAEVVEFLKRPEKFTRLGGALPTGVLLVGPPGTGKTLMAKAVAGEAGVPFFSISGSDFMEMFVGVGARRVRDLFEQAKQKAPCIIFIDEMDAVGRTRGRGQVGGGTDERDNTLNQLLVEMDGFDSDEGVVIMGATNRPDVLDSALLRPGRFDRQIAIPKPDRRERTEIFRVHIADLRLDETVDLEGLARRTPGFAGAEIENVCNEAALLAARDGKAAVQQDDFERAVERVVAGLEKNNKLISPEEREIIAYHESGHAVVEWFLEHTDPVVKVSIVPRGLSALGHAQHLPEERDLYSKEALLDRMTMALGGRAAEEIVYGDVTTGAQDDLERVTKMAYAMVVDYGMSDRLGPLSYDRSREVRALVDEARSRAKTLLRKERALLDDLAAALLDREVLDSDALATLLGERPHGNSTPTSGRASDGGEAVRKR